MFPRLILTLIIVVAAIAFVRHVRQRMARRARPVANSKTVRCEHCQVYLPRAEAVERHGQYFCSVEHADSGAP